MPTTIIVRVVARDITAFAPSASSASSPSNRLMTFDRIQSGEKSNQSGLVDIMEAISLKPINITPTQSDYDLAEDGSKSKN
jgi:hypothetical protein